MKIIYFFGNCCSLRSQSCLKHSTKWVNEVEWVSKVKVILWPWAKVTQISKLNVWLLACILRWAIQGLLALLLGQLWQLFEVSQILEFLRYKHLWLYSGKDCKPEFLWMLIFVNITYFKEVSLSFEFEDSKYFALLMKINHCYAVVLYTLWLSKLR